MTPDRGSVDLYSTTGVHDICRTMRLHGAATTETAPRPCRPVGDGVETQAPRSRSDPTTLGLGGETPTSKAFAESPTRFRCQEGFPASTAPPNRQFCRCRKRRTPTQRCSEPGTARPCVAGTTRSRVSTNQDQAGITGTTLQHESICRQPCRQHPVRRSCRTHQQRAHRSAGAVTATTPPTPPVSVSKQDTLTALKRSSRSRGASRSSPVRLWE